MKGRDRPGLPQAFRNQSSQAAQHKDKIALAIVDLSLPDSDIVKCPMALGEIKPDIYYLIATGKDNDGSFDRENRQLRVVWLQKPFKEKTIVEHVKRLAYPY